MTYMDGAVPVACCQCGDIICYSNTPQSFIKCVTCQRGGNVVEESLPLEVLKERGIEVQQPKTLYDSVADGLTEAVLNVADKIVEKIEKVKTRKATKKKTSSLDLKKGM